MILTFRDIISYIPCKITADTVKVQIVELEGIEDIPSDIEKIYLDNIRVCRQFYKEFSKYEQENFFRGSCFRDPRKEYLKHFMDWQAIYAVGGTYTLETDGEELNRHRHAMEEQVLLMKQLLTPSEQTEYGEIPEMADTELFVNRDALIKSAYAAAAALESSPQYHKLMNLRNNTKAIVEAERRQDKWTSFRVCSYMPTAEDIRRCADTGDLKPLKEYRHGTGPALDRVHRIFDEVQEHPLFRQALFNASVIPVKNSSIITNELVEGQMSIDEWLITA